MSGTVSAINAGEYSATATLLSGYVWSDDTTDPRTIPWKINKAESTLRAKGKSVILSYAQLHQKYVKVNCKKVLTVTRTQHD